MNKFSLAVLAVFAASPAVAADLVEPAPEPVVEEVATSYDWSGKYIGIHKGGSWLDSDFKFQGENDSENFNGFMIGAFAGYNFTFDNFVVGVEGDINYNWVDERYRAVGLRGDVGTDVAGSLRARLGYSIDRTLIYATGGWAATNGFVERGNNDKDKTFNGWTLGAGVDWAFTDNIFIRGEYRFTDYNDKTFKGLEVDLDQHQAVIGVAYKF